MIHSESLAEIADRHGCDKGLVGPSTKWSANNYVDVYEAMFRPIRLEPLRLLEIGIGVRGAGWDAKIVHGANSEGGASLKMWAEYFPNAQIYGLDINDASHLDSDRIRTFHVDQSERSELRKILAELGDIRFDIVIDDGSHRADHQQVSLETIWPRLKGGRHYFIEDLNDPVMGGGGRHSSVGTVSTRQFFRRFAEAREISERNAFESTTFLQEVEDIVFFCPRPLVRLRDIAVEGVRLVTGRNLQGLSRTEYNARSHRLLALRKRVSEAQ